MTDGETAGKRGVGAAAVLRIALAAGAVGAAGVLWGKPALVALLLILPAAAETLRAKWGEGPALAAASALGTLAALLLQGPAMIGACLWCLAAAALTVFPVSRPLARAAVWAGLAAAAECAGIALLLSRYDGRIMAGLAGTVTDLVSRSPRGNAILLWAYQAGLVGLEDKLAAFPAMRLGGAVIMTDAVRTQLLYGLRLAVQTGLETFLPQLAVAWVFVTALLTAALPDALARRRGDTANLLPAFSTWHMPRGLGAQMGILALGYLAPYLTEESAVVYFGLMCFAAFQLAYMLQGASTLAFLQKKTGARRETRWIWTAVLLVFLPAALTLLGVADQVTPMRGLRGEKDEEEDP